MLFKRISIGIWKMGPNKIISIIRIPMRGVAPMPLIAGRPTVEECRDALHVVHASTKRHEYDVNDQS
jgi:hypothetical protein